MPDSDAVCVLIPTLDEAETIGDVVRSFREEGFETAYTMDQGVAELADKFRALV